MLPFLFLPSMSAEPGGKKICPLTDGKASAEDYSTKAGIKSAIP